MTPEQTAKSRFMKLTMLRISAAALVILGAMMATGKFETIDASLANPLGIAMIVMGFADLVIIIPMLLRRWRSSR
jgi:hypothetical protein